MSKAKVLLMKKNQKPRETEVNRRPRQRMDVIDFEIRNGNYPNSKDIAKILEVCRETVRRDIKFMRNDLKAPLEFDYRKNGYYYTAPDYFIPSTRVTNDDIENLKLAEQIIEKYEKTLQLKGIKETFGKIYKYLPNDYSLFSSPMKFSQNPLAEISSGAINIIKKAFFCKKEVEITYESFNSQKTSKRIVDPYYIHEKYTNSLYVIAYCHNKKDVRVFAMHRIRKAKILENEYKIPSDFCPEEYLKDSFSLEKGSPIYNFVFKFTSKQAKYLREKTWHHSQTIENLEDGSILFKLQARGLNELKRWVLQYGGEVEVIEPLELRKEVCQELEKMLKVYSIKKKGD